MCGICGVVSSGQVIDRSIIQKMNSMMSHRGPDDSSIYSSSQGGVASSVGLGHRRLSIIDLSPAGRQPIANEDESIWLALNGEIYNYRELRKELQGKGHTFRSHTDSEVVIHLYEEYGKDCLSYLSGMFSFAIWDENRNRLFLARDRVGKKPLQYYYKENLFIFASEFASLLASGLVTAEVNMEGIDNYLSFGYIPSPMTGYQHISKLPPGHYLTYQNGNVEVQRYWDLSYSPKISDSFHDASEKVMELLTEAVKMRLESDVPLGAFLSGGVDSSAIVALMSELSSEKIKTFSIGFNEQQYSELEYARKVAEYFNTDHHEFVVKPDALEVLPLLVEHYGEPYADSSAIPTYYVSKLTRQHVTVALNGDGGDEVFAGYERYYAMRAAEYYQKIPKAIRKFICRPLYRKIPDSTDPRNKLRRMRRFLEGAEYPAAERYLKWVGIFNPVLKGQIYSKEMKRRLNGTSPLQHFQSFFDNYNELGMVDKLLKLDTNLYLPFDLLVKVDITSMANSLEARSPFLDHKLMEYVARLPSSYKLKGLTLKYLLKKIFTGKLPDENIQRRKMGFGVPIRLWFRNELKDFLRDVLLCPDSLKRGYFNPIIVEKMVTTHISGQRDNSFQLWTLLMLELWHKRFIDN